MSRMVSILGVGQTPVVKRETRSVGALAECACRIAMADAGINDVDAVFVGNMLSGELMGQNHLGPLVATAVSDGHIEGITVDAACGSGGAVVRQAYLSVAAGAYDVVLAVGVEKMSGFDRDVLPELLGSAADRQREVASGATFVALNALLMQRYMYEYGMTRLDFAPFAEVPHENAATNSNARLRAGCTRQDYLSCRMLSDPIGIYDASPIADGAAAVVLGSRPRKNRAVIRIAGSACATDSLSLQQRSDPLRLRAVEESALAALDQAGKDHDEVDLFELHDAFTIMSALSLEASGFTPRGTAPCFARERGICREGTLPISTFGGLKARGHPVGASGAYQVVEAVLQLRGEAGRNQVRSPRVAMTQSIGGSGATAITHVFERVC
jgi:acetyl-CoA C-acetyltransferase